MALAMRSALAAPARPSLRTQTTRRPLSVRAMATPTQQNKGNVESAISEAEEICASGKAKDCAVAWDTVEELSAAADKKRKVVLSEDPLEKFCESAPDADECRVYED